MNIIIYGSDGATKELTFFKDGGITLPIEETNFLEESYVTVDRSTVSRQGNIVIIYASIKLNSQLQLNEYKKIGNIPEGFHPKKDIATVGIQGSTGECSAWITSSGEVYIRPHSAAPANTIFEFMLVYNKAATWGIQQEVITDG